MKFLEVNESLLLKDFSKFPSKMLESSFREYKVSIQQINSLRAELQTLRSQQKSNSNLYRDRLKSLQFEYSNLFLLELYLKSLSQIKCTLNEQLNQKITKSYGSLDSWRNDFYHLSQSRNTDYIVLTYNKSLDCIENLTLKSESGFSPTLTPLLCCQLPKTSHSEYFGMDGTSSLIESFLYHANFDFASHNLRKALAK
ncbi:MAG: hypothetical protein KC646_02030 [Candidatus Cloacimonetes bacterium]|nr:hypothetical protein [Candidatus Cloacimonadota bacterium]